MHGKLRSYRTYGEWFHAPMSVIRTALKETWFQLHHPLLYARLQRMRAHKRATWYRRQKETQDMSMFRIGQQVACINRAPWRWHPQDGGEDVCQEGPKFGEVVTIDGFHWEDDRFLLLNGWPMLAFDPFQFRPVKKTDISVFTAMLNPVRQKEKA